MSKIGDSCSFVNDCIHFCLTGCDGINHHGCRQKLVIIGDKPNAPEKSPILLYVQEKETGIGKLYLNGKLVKGLQKMSIEAETDTENFNFPKLKIETTPGLMAKNFIKE